MTPSPARNADAAAAGKYDITKMRRTEKFFYVTYFNFLKGPAKWVILLVFAGVFTGVASVGQPGGAEGP